MQAESEVAYETGPDAVPLLSGVVVPGPWSRLIDSDSGFAALRPAWDDLQARAVHASVFVTWEWQYLWWQSYGSPGSLRLIVVGDGAQVLGILPLYREAAPIAGRAHATVLRLVGTGGDTWPDDLGPLLAPGSEATAAHRLCEFLLNVLREWDVLLLTDLRADCPFRTRLARESATHRLRHTAGVSARIAYMSLPARWDDYLAGLSRDRRWRLRNARRRLAAQGPVRFFVWQDADRLDAAVDRLVELHHARWQAAGRKHSFASARYVGFHRAVMRACLTRGWLRLYCLEANDRLIAIYYFYRYRNRVFLMQGGFDPECASLKPGEVLLGYALEDAIGEGNEVLDFLRGEHRYKDERAIDYRETVGLTLYRPTPAALAYRLRQEWWPAAKRRIKTGLARLGLCAPAPGH